MHRIRIIRWRERTVDQRERKSGEEGKRKRGEEEQSEGEGTDGCDTAVRALVLRPLSHADTPHARCP